MFPLLYRIVIALFAAAMMAGAASAQEPTPAHLAAARDLILLTKALNSVDVLLPQFGEQIKRRNVARPELTKDLDQVIENLKPELELQKQQAINTAARVYAKWLSEAELKDLITFYKSPVGQKFLQVQPGLVDDVVNAIDAWTQQASEYVMVRVRAEMGKRNLQLQ